MARYERLSSPGRIGTLTIPNRIVMTAASASLTEPDGRMTEDMLAYYEARARGGVGLIITEMVCVDGTRGVLFPRELDATCDERIADFRALADRVHPYGTRIFAQLFHPGANADPKLNRGELIAASPMRGKKRGQARAATPAELEELAAQFGAAARRVQLAGFDGVEVHAAHHYLLHSFLSPVTNRRTDEFGGSLEDRTRLLRMIVAAIRAACGPTFPLMFRISIEEYIGRDGYHADTGVKICQLLEEWGVDAINASASGTDSKLSQSVEPMCYPQGWRRHLGRAVKAAVRIPVLAVAVIRDPAYAERLLEEGALDFVGSVRSHLADPRWAEKALTGRDEDIVPCLSCMACFARFETEGHITCAVAPETGYEARIAPLVPDGAGRPVVVLGAGPAGLMAAWTAARRGFAVTVYERADEPGGQLRLAQALPRKERIGALVPSLLRRCAQAGVTLRCGHAPTAEELAALRPYAVLDATGGRPKVPPIEGIDGPLVCTAADVIAGRVDPRGESVVVVGSGMTGLETAELLSDWARDDAVLVIEAAHRIAPRAQGSNRNVVTAVLDLRNVALATDRRLTWVGADRIWMEDPRTGETYEYPCDRVVLALGTEPEDPYGDTLEGLRVVPVGDRVRGGDVWAAIHSGDEAGRGI